MAVEALEQRTMETIARSRALLAASGRRLDRREAELKRRAEGQEREQAAVDRASAESERHLAAQMPDPSKPIERAEALRRQALAAITAFAATEEEIAKIHERIAASQPSRRDEYRRIAEHARDSARKAHDILRALSP